MEPRARHAARLHAVALAIAVALVGATASAATVWSGALDGLQEVGPNASPASGSVTLTYDPGANALTVDLTWSSLISAATAGHIHCCADLGTNIGVAVPLTGIPAAVSGSYLNSFDLGATATYASTFLTAFGGGTADGARDALLTALDAGRAYVNLHTVNFPGGEIRSNVQPVPEPGTAALLAGGAAVASVIARRRNSALR